jgi:hypothetical protein
MSPMPITKLQPQAQPVAITGWRAIAGLSVGSAALGALAVGAVAIGALAIGRLKVGRAQLGTVEIDELTVKKLRVLDGPTPGAPAGSASAPARPA